MLDDSGSVWNKAKEDHLISCILQGDPLPTTIRKASFWKQVAARWNLGRRHKDPQSLMDHFFKQVLPNLSFHPYFKAEALEKLNQCCQSRTNPPPEGEMSSDEFRSPSKSPSPLEITSSPKKKRVQSAYLKFLQQAELEPEEREYTVIRPKDSPKPTRAAMKASGFNSRRYSDEEDKMIISRILAHAKKDRLTLKLHGREFWQNLEKKTNQLNNARTWQSMKERFIKYIAPNISRFVTHEQAQVILECTSLSKEQKQRYLAAYRRNEKEKEKERDKSK